MRSTFRYRSDGHLNGHLCTLLFRQPPAEDAQRWGAGGMIEGQPVPATDDPLDAAYWSAAREGRLVVQTCGDCGKGRFPPRPMCPHCQSEAVGWREDNGTATVWSFAVPSPPLLPAFEAMLPYVTVIAALDSDPTLRIAGMAVKGDGEPTGLTATGLSIGQRVEVEFRQVAPECTLPVWQLETTKESQP